MPIYTQQQLPGHVFDAGSGSGGNVVNWNGKAVKVFNQGDGTRRIEDLGDWNVFESGRKAEEASLKQRRDLADRAAGYKQEIGDFTNELETKVPQMTSDVYSRYKIPDQVSSVNALNTRIAQLRGGSNQGETAGGFASADQVDKALQTGYLPQFNTAVGNLNTSLQGAQTELGNLLQPLYTKGELLNDRVAREMTAFSQQDQNELDVLLAKLDSGTRLTLQEMQNLNNLAQKEKDFERTKFEYANREKNTEIVTVGGRKKLIDKNTGQVISDLGPSTSDSGGRTASDYLSNSATIGGGSSSGGGDSDWFIVG